MNPLVKKEIRLLLPVWLAVLVLDIALPWIGSEPVEAVEMAPVFFFFGMILLAVDSFGREFSLGTFSALLSQPMERRQIWRTKITVLLIAAGLIFAVYFASCEIRMFLAVANNHNWERPEIQSRFFCYVMSASVAGLFVALAGGLWTALLLRQISAAFWIAFLIPAGMFATGTLCLPEKYADNGHAIMLLLYGLAIIYVAAGFWVAHRLFHRAQDAAWAGGVISFSTWRDFSASGKSSFSMRRERPLAALLKKEFQLQSISLFCAGSLLVLHLGIFLLRITFVPFHRSPLAEGISNLFWLLWLVMPFVIGGTSVAEERKLDLAESQFCLPVARRTQFAVKFFPVMIFGTLLGGVVPMLLESLAAAGGAPSENFRSQNHVEDLMAFEAGVVALAAGLSWVSFFGSTLARNFLQALSIAIVIIVGGCLLASGGDYFGKLEFSILGVLPWPSVMPILIGVPTLLVTLMWLLYRNYLYFHEGWRLWRRNIRGILTAALFVFVSSALLYNRVWEVLEPAEPAHGPAKFSPANPPILEGDNYSSLLVRLPDGRVWFDSLGYPFVVQNQPSRWKQLWWFLVDPRPASVGPQQFVAGSNWVSLTAKRVDPWTAPRMNGSGLAAGYLDTVGVKANGTLWISSRTEPTVWTGGEMMQFGDETDWRQVVRQPGGNFLLLKNNGTLWRWGNGTNLLDWGFWPTNWPTVRNSPLRQIGTNSDWQDIFSCAIANARKTDGSSWIVRMNIKTGQDTIDRQTNFDQIPYQTFSYEGDSSSAYVGADGCLWISNRHAREDGQGWEGTGFLPVGTETNWVAVAAAGFPPTLMALKADGSLWQWPPAQKSTAEFSKTPPARLGIHSDWIGLTRRWSGAVALAADGSLWFWPLTVPVDRALKFPKQPRQLGNVFSQPD